MTWQLRVAERRGLNRRSFIEKVTGQVGLLLAPNVALGAADQAGASSGKSGPNDRLNVAAVGLGPRGHGNLAKCSHIPLATISSRSMRSATSSFSRGTLSPRKIQPILGHGPRSQRCWGMLITVKHPYWTRFGKPATTTPLGAMASSSGEGAHRSPNRSTISPSDSEDTSTSTD